ncbi:hypothetical protein [Granulicella rosea]|nr:hypothetical protein [Granulicella rosea]
MLNPTIRIAATSLMLAGLAGCGLRSTVDSKAPVVAQGVTLQGAVHGGQQPVVGASILLYAANAAGGYGSSSTALLTSPVTTDATGGFAITGLYTCPSASSLVYLVSVGGNPGVGGANANLAMMSALGPCGHLTASTFININELTTVASVYALSPFMKSYKAVGTSAGNPQGLANAFATVNNLVNIGTGTLSGPTLPANAVLPSAELNTLADILAACINSAGGAAGDGSTCGSLFRFTTASTIPADTIGAALNIARNPGSNVASLLALSSSAAPYQPTLASATDFTVSIRYKTGGFSSPSASAVDAGGNLWVTNAGGNSVTVLNPAGSPAAGSPFTGGGLGAPSAIAVDAGGNAWIASSGNSTLSVFTPAGSGTQTSASGLGAPSAVAIDAQGIVWVTNAGNSTVTAVATSGTSVTSSNSYSAGGINTPTAVAIDPY